MRRNFIVCTVFRKMAGTARQMTNLTGLPVSLNAKNILNRVYKRTKILLEKMPKDYPYRKYTEGIINQRVAIINSTDDLKVMEEKIGYGMIEEVIIQARNELQLTEHFLLVRPWEALKTSIPKNQWNWPVK